jgi:excisionase family DNA binding protein
MDTHLIVMNPEQLNGIIQRSISEAVQQLPAPEKQPEQVRFCTISETQEILKLSRPTIWKHTKSGLLKGYKLGKRVLYRFDELEASIRKMNFEPRG